MAVWAATALAAALAMVLQVLLARVLPDDALALFSLSVAVAQLAAAAATWGVPQLLLRQSTGEEPVAADQLRAAIFILRAGAALAAVVAVVILTATSIGQAVQRASSGLMSALLIISLAGTECLVLHHQSRSQLLAVAKVTLEPWAVRLLLVAPLVLLAALTDAGANEHAIFAAFGVPALLVMWRLRGLEAGGWFSWREAPLPSGRLVNLSYRRPRLSLLASATPYAMSNVLFLVYYQIDIVMLGYVGDPALVANYSLAAALLGAVYILPNVLFGRVLLRDLHFTWQRSPATAYRSVGSAAIKMTQVGLLATAGIWTLGPTVAVLMFGHRFGDLPEFLRILCVGAPLRFASTGLGAGLLAAGLARQKTAVMLAAAVFNVVANLYAIPRFGGTGAAVTTLLTELVLFSGYLFVRLKQRPMAADELSATGLS